jgi:hypothetical protein
MATNLVPLFALERCRTQLAQIAALVHLPDDHRVRDEGGISKAILHLIQNIERDLNVMNEDVPCFDRAS